MHRPFESLVLCLLLLFLAAGAIYGGGSLILSPDGSLLQMDAAWLNLIPFPDFLIPGLLLFAMLGIFPLVALSGLFFRKKNRLMDLLNIYPDKFWGWTFTLYTGIVCIAWIVFQQVLTEYFILQPFIAAVGLLMVILSLVPRVQRFYTIPDDTDNAAKNR